MAGTEGWVDAGQHTTSDKHHDESAINKRLEPEWRNAW